MSTKVSKPVNTPPLLREIDTMVKRAETSFDAESVLQKGSEIPPAAIERPTQDPPRIGKDGRPESRPQIAPPNHAAMMHHPDVVAQPATREEIAAMKAHAQDGCKICSAHLMGLRRGVAGQQAIQKQADTQKAQAAKRVRQPQPQRPQAPPAEQPTVTRAQAQVQTIDRQIAALQEAGAKMIANPGLQVQLANTVYLLMQRRAALSDAR